jgi:hypothetical protein
MTRPSMLFVGAEPAAPGGKVIPKIFLRALLYSTGKRGCVVESMYVRLTRAASGQTFPVWMMDTRRGSGMYVGEDGVVCDHHFFLPPDGSDFQFLPGDYELAVFAALARDKPIELCRIRVPVSGALLTELQIPEKGLWFDWSPESGEYSANVRPVRFTTPK